VNREFSLLRVSAPLGEAFSAYSLPQQEILGLGEKHAIIYQMRFGLVFVV
jgi:hypothetical protein